MEMTAILFCVGAAFVLLIRNIKLRAYLEGYREAQKYIVNSNTKRDTHGAIKALAVIGLFTVFGTACFCIVLVAEILTR